MRADHEHFNLGEGQPTAISANRCRDGELMCASRSRLGGGQTPGIASRGRALLGKKSENRKPGGSTPGHHQELALPGVAYHFPWWGHGGLGAELGVLGCHAPLGLFRRRTVSAPPRLDIGQPGNHAQLVS